MRVTPSAFLADHSRSGNVAAAGLAFWASSAKAASNASSASEGSWPSGTFASGSLGLRATSDWIFQMMLLMTSSVFCSVKGFSVASASATSSVVVLSSGASFSVTDSAAISLTSPGLITNDVSVRGLGCGGVTGDRTIASSSPVAIWFSIEGDLSGTSSCCLVMAAGSANLPPTETGADGTVPPQAATPRSRPSTGQ